MNPLYDFNANEIALIQMAISAVEQSTRYAIENGVVPPEGLLETVESIINKLDLVVEARIENDNRFDEIVNQQLSDVKGALMIISSDPNQEVGEYN